jgi:hypothetical protein
MLPALKDQTVQQRGRLIVPQKNGANPKDYLGIW